MIIDALAYFVLSLIAFGLTVVLWRGIFADFRNWIDRFLFWGTVVGVAIMFAGWYHAVTGDRAFGFVLMMLALGEAMAVMLTVNLFAARAYSKPYDPEQDPEFLAEMEERRRLREENTRHYLADLRGELAAPDERRLLR